MAGQRHQAVLSTGKYHGTDYDQRNARTLTKRNSSGENFFYEHESRKPDNPIRVHYATCKQQGYQKPTALETIGSVSKPHMKRTKISSSATFGQILHR